MVRSRIGGIAMMLFRALLLLMALAGPALAWNQSANARKIVPNDYWYNHRVGSADGSAVADTFHLAQWPLLDDWLNLPRAWSITTGDSSIVVVCSDLGIQGDHPELAPRILRSTGEPGVAGVDDDGDGNADRVWLAAGDKEGKTAYGYPPWYETETGFEVTDTEGRHGTRCLGQLIAATDNGVGTAGIDWECKVAPAAYPYVGNQTLINWVRYLIDERRADVRFVSASYASAFTSREVAMLIDMGVLPVAGAGNNNSTTIVNAARGDSVLIVGAVRHDYLRTSGTTASGSGGSSYGSAVDCVGYSSQLNSFYTWQSPSDVTASEAWRPDHYIVGATGATEALAIADLRSKSSPPLVPYSYWMPENSVTAGGFWDGTTGEVWRAIAYLGPDNRPAYGTYDVRVDGVIFSETMTSGAVPQAVGVGTLYCAHAKANHVSPAPHPLGVREAILRGCVSVDAANSTASGGTNRCCAAGTEVSCCPSACTWDDDCDGKLGAGRLDAYRTLTLWGRCDRDTTLKGDVYVSGDVIFTGGATVTIQGGATIHVMPEDITYVDQWQPALWYDPDGEDDGDCMLDDQDAGEEAKIEIVFDNVTLNITGGDFVPVRITSFASAETDTDWCRVVISSGATVTGLNDRSLLVSGATHGIVDER